jgi:hypothetical protein
LYVGRKGDVRLSEHRGEDSSFLLQEFDIELIGVVRADSVV